MDKQLKSLAVMWFEDLAGHMAEDFLEAVRKHRRSSNFFPTVKEISDRTNEAARIRQMAKPQNVIEYRPQISLEELREIRERNFPKVQRLASRVGRKV